MKNHYSDPTANTAIANVDRELRKQKEREEQQKKAAAAERCEEKPEMLPEKRRKLEAEKRYNAWLQLVWPVPSPKEREVA